MKIFSIAKGFHRLGKNILPELSDKELNRLRALNLFNETSDTGLVCRTFGISRATLYRWLKRFNPRDLSTKTASEFIDTLQRRMPFDIEAIQVDGGSEFFADFERLCRDKGIRLFVLPPKSPKLNGARWKEPTEPIQKSSMRSQTVLGRLPNLTCTCQYLCLQVL